jgi:mannose-1-phosphate guanylyltransferase
MTVDRNKNIADKVMVVGNIDNRHLSEKSIREIEYLTLISLSQLPEILLAFAAFASAPDDILIVTHPDHIIGNADLYEQSIQEAMKKQQWFCRYLWYRSY